MLISEHRDLHGHGPLHQGVGFFVIASMATIRITHHHILMSQQLVYEHKGDLLREESDGVPVPYGAACHLTRWNSTHCACTRPRTSASPDNPPVAQLHLLPWPRHLDLPHVWVLWERCFQTAGPAMYWCSEPSWKGQPIPCGSWADARLLQGSSGIQCQTRNGLM